MQKGWKLMQPMYGDCNRRVVEQLHANKHQYRDTDMGTRDTTFSRTSHTGYSVCKYLRNMHCT